MFRPKYDIPHLGPFRAYSHQRRAFFSAAEILLRKYQNPMHLNGARWPTTFFKTSSANGSHLNVWDFDISAAEKTRVFGVNRPLDFSVQCEQPRVPVV